MFRMSLSLMGRIAAFTPHGPSRHLPYSRRPPSPLRGGSARSAGVGVAMKCSMQVEACLCHPHPVRFAHHPPRKGEGYPHASSSPRPVAGLAISKNASRHGRRSREAGRMAVPLNYIYVAQLPRPAGVLLPRGGSDSICAALARQGPGFHGLGPNRTPSCGQPSAVLPPRASGS